MNQLALISVSVFALSIGCGGDDGDGGDAFGEPNDQGGAGFIIPSETVKAYQEVSGVWTEMGPANFSCLNTPSSDVPSTVPIVLSGVVEDFQTEREQPDATVSAYSGTNFAGAPIASATSDQDGLFEMTLPTGQTRVQFKIELEGALNTYEFNEYFVPDESAQSFTANSVSNVTANALPAFIGVERTVGLGILAGTIRDCDLREVGGAIATVSTTSGAISHVPGAVTYYFSALSTSLPVRHQQQATTNSDGIFVVIELPEAPTAFLQVWGFIEGQDPTSDDMTLLGEIPSPVLSDSVITASMEPLRSN